MKQIRNTEQARNEIFEKWGETITVSEGFTFDGVDKLYTFICKDHGSFESSFYRVMNRKNPCKSCNPTSPKGWEHIKQRLYAKFGLLYDYSLNDETYDDNKKGQQLKIICKVHGLFTQRLGDHLASKVGCPHCVSDTKTITVNDFLFDSIKVHGNTYGYDKIHQEYVTSASMVSILCKKHGYFKQRANDHRRGSGCPVCKSSSKGEQAVATALNRMKVKYIPQMSFEDFKSPKGWKYRYDFYIPEYNTLIEYDGVQHLKDGPLNGFDVAGVKDTDDVKTEYARMKGIHLVRITSLSSIDTILNEIVKGKR
jgi:hypothetical protein